MAHKPKLISIVGPTSAGKTSLSIAVATHFDGEVISADSRQVYRGMDLGSGKVTKEEMGDVPHHLLDVADPKDVYTAHDFKHDAAAAIADIERRGKLPVLAGGSFFYVDNLLGKTNTPEVEPNLELRAELEQKSNEELFAIIETKDPERAKTVDPQNGRRMIRSIEIIEAIGSVPPLPTELPYDVLTIGILIDKEQLHENIHVRLKQRFAEGMLEEVRDLLAAGVPKQRMEDLGLEYRYISRHLAGELSYEEMFTELEAKTRQFAKRQYTWLKRDTDIVWLDPKDTAAVFATIQSFLDE